MGIFIDGWYTLENPANMDDLGVPLFQENHHMYKYIYIYIWGCDDKMKTNMYV